MDPTPGGALDLLNQQMSDPDYKIVAHLAKAPIGAQATQVLLSALVECDFPGYAAIPLTPNLDVAWEESQYGEMSPQRLHFEATNIVVPQAATHIYYTGQYANGSLNLLAAVPFDNPVTFGKPGDAFEVDAEVACLVSPDA